LDTLLVVYVPEAFKVVVLLKQGSIVNNAEYLEVTSTPLESILTIDVLYVLFSNVDFEKLQFSSLLQENTVNNKIPVVINNAIFFILI
jgi:hypothetical protein